MPIPIYPNMSTRSALRAATAYGCSIEARRRTDELVIRHPWRPTRPLTIKGTRKDAPRSLLAFIRSLGRIAQLPASVEHVA